MKVELGGQLAGPSPTKEGGRAEGEEGGERDVLEGGFGELTPSICIAQVILGIPSRLQRASM